MSRSSKIKSSGNKTNTQRHGCEQHIPKASICVTPNTHRCKLRIPSSEMRQRSFYLNTSACQFDRYRVATLLFGATQAGYIFQKKIDEIIKELPCVFSIADEILL